MATGFMFVRRLLEAPHSILGVLGMALSWPALATDVALVGLLPGKALVVVDGGKTRTIPVGTKTPDGIKLLSLEDGAAQFEIDGKRQRLAIGQQSVSTGSDERGAMASLTADAAGHFVTMGTVNGATMRFLVDTGATMVALGAADAARANINFRQGQPGMSMTANGPVRVWRVTLNSVKIGAVTLNQVDATVHENDLPIVLLGMSFLNRVEMKRDGVTMTLQKRY